MCFISLGEVESKACLAFANQGLHSSYWFSKSFETHPLGFGQPPGRRSPALLKHCLKSGRLNEGVVKITENSAEVFSTSDSHLNWSKMRHISQYKLEFGTKVTVTLVVRSFQKIKGILAVIRVISMATPPFLKSLLFIKWPGGPV